MSEPVCTQYAAQRLKVSRRTTSNYIEKGLLRASWVGRRWLIDPASVDELLRSGTPRKLREPKA